MAGPQLFQPTDPAGEGDSNVLGGYVLNTTSLEFNNNLRQLLHVGYKIAAKMGDRYLNMLTEYKASVARNVTMNLVDRHMKPLFLA